MKWLILFAFIIQGCSLSAKKENLREIFTLVKSGKFEDAKSKARSSSGAAGNYETYTGESIPTVERAYSAKDNVISLIKSVEGAKEYCEDKLSESKGLSLKNNEEGSFWYKEKIKNLKDEFNSHCRSEKLLFVEKIKNYADVDLYSMFASIESSFLESINQLNSNIATEENKSELETQKKAEEKERYEQSPEFYVKKLCEMQGIINAASNIIEKENEAGKISGFVSKNRLYEAGKAIQTNTDRIKYFSNEYKTKFNKTWSSKECK